jgi:hypothetical protein
VCEFNGAAIDGDDSADSFTMAMCTFHNDVSTPRLAKQHWLSSG